jgi:hypothetical protein
MTDEEIKAEEQYAVSLEGFLRYKIYPSGRIVDTLMGRNVLFNRNWNFLMYPDDYKLDDKGRPIYELFNLQLLIKDLVKQKIPGFGKEFPPPKPPDYFLPLKKKTPVSEKDIEELHNLRINLKEATEKVLSKPTSLEEVEIAQANFAKAQLALEDFKVRHPEYWKWSPYTRQANLDPALIKELQEEEKEILRELQDNSAKIREIKAKLKKFE